ncbi:hypothetical protein CPB84DRAFT_278240 [Gymnopilus junonius]|uniref:HNH nuclease domain-containing protein n=1 Tax=Gymnopilus junonius TaxID=109634 RepID=A0A9P5ND10_GYMJU|nr:hypothetical protein CPB84DRAFT_278240 [Gymnopilus junonius]
MLLHYFCFIVLGLKGTLHIEGGKVVALEGEESGEVGINVEAGGTYYYQVESDAPFTSALVDPEVVRQLSSRTSTSWPALDPAFQSRLEERDRFGIFTGAHPRHCHGQHIIELSEGDDWLKLIIENRPPFDDEDVSGFSGIDDPRNGFLLSINVQLDLSRKLVFIFKTPNCYLRCEDIPPAIPHRTIYPGNAPPPNCRFTLMWAIGNIDTIGLGFELPSDATFMEPSAADLPSGLLLDYFNAGVLLKNYLKGSEKLASHPFPRPPPLPVGHRRTVVPKSAGHEQVNDPNQDIDAMVLGIWMMSGNARRRHEREEQERTERIDSWRSNLTR